MTDDKEKKRLCDRCFELKIVWDEKGEAKVDYNAKNVSPESLFGILETIKMDIHRKFRKVA